MAKSKLTPAVSDKIIELVEQGNYLKVAAQAVGITERTLYNWLTRGEAAATRFEEEPVKAGTRPKKGQSKEDFEAAKALRAEFEEERPFLQFFQSVEKALAVGETKLVGVISHAVNEGDAKIALEMLRRKFPDRWNPTQSLDVTSKNETTIRDERPDPSQLSDEELRAYMLGLQDGKQEA